MSNLDNINKENNFRVPKDYFEYLPAGILEKAQAPIQQKRISILNPLFAVPSLTILSGTILLLIFLLKKETPPSDEIILSENEIQQIIEDPELYDLDEASITEEYLSLNISAASINNETISDEEIKSYLEENTDINNIINDL